MIQEIFREKAMDAVEAGADSEGEDRQAWRMYGVLIGIAGAVGALEAVLVNPAFRQSFLSSGSGDGPYIAFIAFYVVCVVITWVVYLRPGNRLAGV